MPRASLINLYGKAAVEHLVSEIGKHRELYSVDINRDEDVSILQGRARIAWVRIVTAVQAEFGADATSDACWRSWRSLRFRYIAGFRRPQYAARKWKDKMSFLNDFVHDEPSSKRRPRNPRQQARPLALEYGEDIVKLLLSEIAKYPQFHSSSFVRRTGKVERLPKKHRQSWNRIMDAVREKYPGASHSKAWTTWSTLLFSHCRGKPSRKWIENMKFLDSKHEHPGRHHIQNIQDYQEEEPIIASGKRSESPSSVMVLDHEPSPPVAASLGQYLTYEPSHCAYDTSSDYSHTVARQDDTFRSMLQVIYGKIRKRRNAEIALSTVRSRALRIISHIHDSM